jgi:hypothetical protein
MLLIANLNSDRRELYSRGTRNCHRSDRCSGGAVVFIFQDYSFGQAC